MAHDAPLFLFFCYDESDSAFWLTGYLYEDCNFIFTSLVSCFQPDSCFSYLRNRWSKNYDRFMCRLLLTTRVIPGPHGVLYVQTQSILAITRTCQVPSEFLPIPFKTSLRALISELTLLMIRIIRHALSRHALSRNIQSYLGAMYFYGLTG